MPHRGCREDAWESGFRNGTETWVLLPLWKREWKEDAAQGPVERVHGESGLRNGTETWVLLPLWKGGWIIWPGEAGTNDFCYFWGMN